MLGLAFSGGKDSLACWYLYKNQQPTVFWINTGKAYPETLEIVNEIRAECHNFVEVKTDQQKDLETNGYPSDVVPTSWTKANVEISGDKAFKIQNYLGCCWSNISKPLAEAVQEHRITRLIRGQRNDESYKASSRHGSIVFGVTYLHPIENWTKKQVLDFIAAQRGSLPEHYKIEHSSLDCYDCTGFWKHSADRVAYTKEKHPELYEKYRENMSKIKLALDESMKDLELL
jgi:3'-phosphoadenosine 5'-phosphosulfate sulfotransferase (PAPS reductase)/FAD synthetase